MAWSVLLDLLILLTAALVLGTIAERLKQSSMLGYLLAGTLVGPNVLQWVSSGDTVSLIAELGVALLLFTIGLEFSFTRLRRMGRIALVGGTLQVAVTLVIAALVGGLLAPGIGVRGALAVGAIMALSSTACVLRMLVDRAALESVYGRNSLGILLVQDASVLPLLVLMVVLSGGGTFGDAMLALARTVALGTGLVAALYLILNVIVPRLLWTRFLASNRELPILLAIVIALGSAAAAHQVSISPAMGAFVAGVLLGESPFAVQIRADVSSLRTLLVTMFFASIGMLGDPLWIAQNWYLVLGVVAAIVIGKTAIVWWIYRMLGLGSGMALATGLCVAQVGEFSFVLAETGMAGGVLDLPTFRLIVSATILTLFLTPFLVTMAPRAADRLGQRVRDRPAEVGAAAGEEPEPLESASIVVIGFGPAGHAVVESLHGRFQQQMIVLDMNPNNAATARRYGLRAFVGDATHPEILEHAGIHRAAAVVITVPDPESARRIVHQCRALAPDAAIVVRSRYHVRRWELELAGAHDVVDEEEHVGRRLAARARVAMRSAGAATQR